MHRTLFHVKHSPFAFVDSHREDDRDATSEGALSRGRHQGAERTAHLSCRRPPNLEFHGQSGHSSSIPFSRTPGLSKSSRDFRGSVPHRLVAARKAPRGAKSERPGPRGRNWHFAHFAADRTRFRGGEPSRWPRQPRPSPTPGSARRVDGESTRGVARGGGRGRATASDGPARWGHPMPGRLVMRSDHETTREVAEHFVPGLCGICRQNNKAPCRFPDKAP